MQARPAASSGRTERLRDADRTRQRILEAARREFALKGFDGARVEAIARRARVNKGLIFYYFQSKEELFRTLAEQRINATLPIDQWRAASSPFDWPLRLFSTRDETVDWVRFFFWEGLALDASAAADLRQVELRTSSFRRVVDEVRRQQAAGLLPSELDACQLTFFLYAMGVYPYLLPQMAYLITGHVPADDAFQAKYAEFVRGLGRLLGAADKPVSS